MGCTSNLDTDRAMTAFQPSQSETCFHACMYLDCQEQQTLILGLQTFSLGLKPAVAECLCASGTWLPIWPTWLWANLTGSFTQPST